MCILLCTPRQLFPSFFDYFRQDPTTVRFLNLHVAIWNGETIRIQNYLTMSASILNMEPSICLSLPPLSSSATDNEKDASLTEQHRFIFVTENDFIHAAGNILQISSLPKSLCIDSPLDHLQSDISALSGQFSNANYRLITEEGVKFTEAKLLRGFSCFAYNSYKGRIA